MTWIEINRKRLLYVNRWTRFIKSSLKAQVRPVIDAISTDPVESVIQRIPLLINDEMIRDSFKRLYPDVGARFAIDTYNAFKPKQMTEEEILQDMYFQDMMAFAEREAGIRIVSITNGSKDLAVRLLRQLMQESTIPQGWGVEQTARFFQKEFAQMYGSFDLWRARRIAQTEILTASNKASQVGATGAGANIKIWQCQPGTPKNERHTTYPGLHEQRRDMNQPYDVGGFPAMYPGDPGLPASECINCRCAEVYERL